MNLRFEMESSGEDDSGHAMHHSGVVTVDTGDEEPDAVEARFREGCNIADRQLHSTTVIRRLD